MKEKVKTRGGQLAAKRKQNPLILTLRNLKKNSTSKNPLTKTTATSGTPSPRPSAPRGPPRHARGPQRLRQPPPGRRPPAARGRFQPETRDRLRRRHHDRPRARRRHLLWPAARVRKGREDGRADGFNTMVYSEPEVERIARVAFSLAKKRGNRLTSVDKANVLEVSQLWREVVTRIGAAEFPEIALEHMYVDNAAMQLVRNPKAFDTIVTATSLATSSRTRRRWRRAAWACCPPRPSPMTVPGSSSRSTGPRRTSRARTLPTRWRWCCRRR